MEQKQILWAIDPFEGQLNIDPDAQAELNRWSRHSGLSIQPVYVLNSGPSDSAAVGIIEQRIREFFARSSTEIAKPVVLTNAAGSVNSGALAVVDYAKKASAKVIVVSSHGRSGLARMRFGSFAEAMLKQSSLPLLFMSPKASEGSGGLKRVLWATDFSPHCAATFKSFLKQAHGLVSEVILFHDVSMMVETVSFAGYAGAALPLPEEVIQEQKDWAANNGAEWLKWAAEVGMGGRSIVSADVSNVAGCVLRVARENKVGMIAMASQRGSVSSLLFGSESYQVFRAGEFHAWIYGPQAGEVPPKGREFS